MESQCRFYLHFSDGFWYGISLCVLIGHGGKGSSLSWWKRQQEFACIWVSDKADRESPESTSSSLEVPQPSKTTTSWGPTVITFGPIGDASHPNHSTVLERVSVQFPPSRRESFIHIGFISHSGREQTFLTPGSTTNAGVRVWKCALEGLVWLS